MHVTEEIAKIEARLAKRGESLTAFCDRANIAVSTWTRWKNGSNAPNFTTWNRVKSAADQRPTGEVF